MSTLYSSPSKVRTSKIFCKANFYVSSCTDDCLGIFRAKKVQVMLATFYEKIDTKSQTGTKYITESVHDYRTTENVDYFVY